MRKVNADECINFVKNVLKIKLFDYQEQMLRAFCEGKEVRSARGAGRSYVAKAYGRYVEHLYCDNDYTKEPDVIFDYHHLIANGFSTKERMEQRKLMNPELFEREYECK